jgi:anhydro-N-acetylmuramic acid kinase
MNTYHVVGIMSGTSLDGLDIALCRFEKLSPEWRYDIIKAETKTYPNDWKQMLSEASEYNALEFIKLHKEYGKYIGASINIFLKHCDQKVDFISSHGHTIFHQPENNLTFQLGDGATIAATTGISTICDFRTLDVALEGQGAPLVPIGDFFLFDQYHYCINMGGFANVSFQYGKKRIAFDICPANIKCNELMRTINREYDKNGELGRNGTLNESMLEELNLLDFYHQQPPKSLGKEWVNLVFSPAVDKYKIKLEDKLRTIYEHIAIQIVNATHSKEKKSMFFTGGGTYNLFLMELIKSKSKNKIIIPDNKIIEFKEALIFAFLGVLRYRKEINCLSSVTGARTDNSSGVINLIV